MKSTLTVETLHLVNKKDIVFWKIKIQKAPSSQAGSTYTLTQQCEMTIILLRFVGTRGVSVGALTLIPHHAMQEEQKHSETQRAYSIKGHNT